MMRYFYQITPFMIGTNIFTKPLTLATTVSQLELLADFFLSKNAFFAIDVCTTLDEKTFDFDMDVASLEDVFKASLSEA